LFYTILTDSAYNWQLGFQDSASPTFEGIVELHNAVFFYLVVTLFLVVWMIIAVILSPNMISHKYANHGTTIELIWTMLPAIILVAVAFPSFKLLYLIDEVISPTITVKVIGNQWFWSYEYSDFSEISFDSYMKAESDLELGEMRLLDVDNRVVLPIDTHIRFIVTSTDVIHDFAVPSLGIKIDALPGRLNQASAYIQRPTTMYGQCSELCGVYHGFMPIVIESVTIDNFIDWLSTQA